MCWEGLEGVVVLVFDNLFLGLKIYYSKFEDIHRVGFADPQVVVRRFEFLTRALYESSLLEEEEIL
jgi:hypothetical protein